MIDRRSVPRPRLPDFAALGLVYATDLVDGAHTAEAAQIAGRVTESRLTTFRLGRAAAHEALGKLGKPTTRIPVGRDREPVWPAGVVGSISHVLEAGVSIVAPASRSDGVGVDLETNRSLPELLGQVPTEDERVWLDRLSPDEKLGAALRLFSAKEAIYKAFFPRVRRFFGFEAANLVPNDGGFSGRLAAGIDMHYTPARVIDVDVYTSDTYTLSVVVLPKSG